MQWHSVAEFFDMGGYALYVWGSFGATAVLLALEVLVLRQQRKTLLARLRRTDTDQVLSA